MPFSSSESQTQKMMWFKPKKMVTKEESLRRATEKKRHYIVVYISQSIIMLYLLAIFTSWRAQRNSTGATACSSFFAMYVCYTATICQMHQEILSEIFLGLLTMLWLFQKRLNLNILYSQFEMVC